MSSSNLNVAVVAGEASGDILAALLIDGLREFWPEMFTYGIGGPKMSLSGFQTWWPHHKLSVHGYGWDVWQRYWEIIRIRDQLKARLLKDPPAIFIGVDAPDFNLDLEFDLKAQGVKTVHFVSPSIWAWRPDRVKKIQSSVDHVLCIFPFEPDLLARHGISATYVGHPLAAVIPILPDQMNARLRLGLRNEDEVVAILPGSRKSEIKYLAKRFFEAVALLVKSRPNLKLIVPAIPALKTEIERAIRKSGLVHPIQIVSGDSHTVLAACDVALIASGTATLEAALFKKPMVIAYRMSWVSWQFIKRKRLQPWVGLPNILLQDFAVPEFLQDAATAKALSKALASWLDDRRFAPEKIAALKEKFTVIHKQLSRDTPKLAANAIQKILQN